MSHAHTLIRSYAHTCTQVYPECVDLGSAATCLATLKAICDADPARFPNLDTGCASLHAVVETARDVTSPDYNLVGIIPDPTGNYAVGPHGNCLQHYELPWMVNGVETDVGPFDCTVSAGAKCLPMSSAAMSSTAAASPSTTGATRCSATASPPSRPTKTPTRIGLG